MMLKMTYITAKIGNEREREFIKLNLIVNFGCPFPLPLWLHGSVVLCLLNEMK